ncbi:PKD domain-containing protein, partial [bacterium]|nr:PKD domain-containing protein [bacterium]
MDGKQGQRFLILVFLVTLTSQVLAQGLMKPQAPGPEYQAIQIPAHFALPVIDGNLDDTIWAKAAPDSLLRGGEPNKWNRGWADYADNLVIWKAAWSDETNRLYVAIEIQDDIRGTFDNTNHTENVYRPYEDESIEFFVDPDKSGGNYFPYYDSAQQWRISGQGLVNLGNYSHDGSRLYDGTDFIGAVQAGTNGNWTCEAQFILYDDMHNPSTIKDLVEGIQIGWDIWYNDSDDENYTADNYFKRDQQTGWYYAGKAYENANFFATMTLEGLPTIANFGVTRREIVAGSQITFSDSSNGDVTEWYWNFEGGEPEIAIGSWDHTVTYNTPGTYDVTLIVNGSVGADTLVQADFITVHPLPVADFAANVTIGGRDLNVIFTNLSQNIGDNPAWQWEFPDGLPNTQNGPGPHTITYPKTGQFDVRLILTNSWGADTLTKVDYIQILPPPTAAFTQSGNSGSAPLDIIFTDASVGEITNWHWEFPGGLPETADSQGPIQVNYATTGLYSVELQVSGPGGTDTLRLDNNIQVFGAPQADFTADKTVGSAPLSVEFTDNSAGEITNWSWEFPGGDPATANSGGPHIVTYIATGTYSVTLTIEGPGGINTETKTNFITVIAPPVAKFGAEPRTGITPLLVTFTDSSTGIIDSYEWEFQGGGPATASGIGPHQITYNTPGVWSAKLTVTGPGGTDVLPFNNFIEVLPKSVADFSGTPLTGTTPLDVVFTSTATGSLDSWEWTFEGGLPQTVSGEGPHIVRYNNPGQYAVELIVSGKADADTLRRENYITVSNPTDPPVADFTADKTSGPIPLTVEFTSLVTGGVENWSWLFEGGTPTNIDGAGPHTVTYENIGQFAVQLI